MSRTSSFVRRGLLPAIAGSLCPVAAAQTAQFSDQTAAANLTAVSTAMVGGPGNEMPLMTGGVAVGDFDGDGWQDIFVLGGPGAPDKLYMNNHDGTFTDRAAAWGVDRTHWGFGIAVGDYDGDGRLDVFITSGGATGASCDHLLYHNNGNGTFTNVAQQAGVRSTVATGFDGLGAAWGDYDLDGRLDLAVAGYSYGSGGNRLFHNNGDGTFTDVTPVVGGAGSMMQVLGFSPKFIDMNGDRYPELLWIADFGSSKYFANNGDGTFTQMTSVAGVGLEGNGMGVTVGDFNNDGRPDFYVTSVYTLQQGHPGVPGTGNMLYLNQGSNHFTETSLAAGVKNTGWGWGTVAADFRHIGRQDIVATNGWQGSNYNGEFLSDPTCVFLNNGGATPTFASAAPACGVTHTGEGRGLVVFDYNNDGRPDILIATNGGPLTLYRNDTPGAGSYLRVFLNTHASHGLAPNGYGAHVIVTTGGSSQHRWITGGSNYLSQSELSAHFGLGSATAVTQLRIEWPDGSVTTRSSIGVDRTITVAACPGDWNADGQVSVQDIFDYLNDWFAGSADVNGSGTTTTQDIFDFLNGWFSGC
ncbi:MAG TPA: CRTAC1 family protein [Phycisphaerales bacterium]|nr:CRTAC1 family protein [Phycisphaerales bacterium]